MHQRTPTRTGNAVMDSTTDLTQLLTDWQQGDAKALSRLIPHVYADLRAMASRRLAEHQGHDTLQSTALVHEVFLRILGCTALEITDRQHFFNFAGCVMRQLLVDRARRSASLKRGSGVNHEALHDNMQLPIPEGLDIEALDEALQVLENLDPRMAKIIELRWFVGLSVDETGKALGIDSRTVYRDWIMAKAWLRDRIEQA